MPSSISSFVSFLNASPTSFHTIQTARAMLDAAGYQELRENTHWHLEPGYKGYVVRNESAMVIFQIPEKEAAKMGYSIATAHTDSPALKLKLPAAVNNGKDMLKIPVEIYGGTILSTWLDRPLGIAGRIAYPDDKGNIQASIVCSESPIAIIPNAAHHLNRNVNNGFIYNPQTHLPCFVPAKSIDSLLSSLARTKLPDSCQIGAELYLYDSSPATVLSMAQDSSKTNEELINAPRLDNLCSCYAILSSLCQSKPPKSSIRLGFLSDNEEIGSLSYQGARGAFLRDILFRLSTSLTNGPEDYMQMLADSQLISIDASHAFNPNFSDLHDPAYRPVQNGGIVIKENADLKFATDSIGVARCINTCLQANIPWQRYAVPSDRPSGSTIGPVCSAAASIPAADIGIALWAMHSCRETAGVKDMAYLEKFLNKFWE